MDPDLKYAVIAAGGEGARMNSRIPKQFLAINGMPILMLAINAFAEAIPSIQLIIVLPPAQIPTWKSLIGSLRFTVPHRIVEGGSLRFDSVRNGLEKVPDNSLVAIHDGARPVVPHQLIRNCFLRAKEQGCAVPCIHPVESVRWIEKGMHRPVSRENIRIVQTPQVFQAALIKKAYQQPFRESFTDDATVLEASGHPIHLVEGYRWNIKITYPEDLAAAEAVMKSLNIEN